MLKNCLLQRIRAPKLFECLDPVFSYHFCCYVIYQARHSRWPYCLAERWNKIRRQTLFPISIGFLSWTESIKCGLEYNGIKFRAPVPSALQTLTLCPFRGEAVNYPQAFPSVSGPLFLSQPKENSCVVHQLCSLYLESLLTIQAWNSSINTHARFPNWSSAMPLSPRLNNRKGDP